MSRDLEESGVQQDLYEVLGVRKSATQEEIIKAYRKLASRQHPDNNPDDPLVPDRFTKTYKAYRILSDPSKKRIYDRYGLLGLKLADRFGEENIESYLMLQNPIFQCLCYSCLLVLCTGTCCCFFCCCCCCCCRGKLIPDEDNSKIRSEDLEDDEPINIQPSVTPPPYSSDRDPLILS